MYGNFGSLSNVIGVFDRSMQRFLLSLQSRRVSGIGVSGYQFLALTEYAIAQRTLTFWNLANVDLCIISMLISKFFEPPEQLAIVPAHERGAVIHWFRFNDCLLVFKSPEDY